MLTENKSVNALIYFLHTFFLYEHILVYLTKMLGLLIKFLNVYHVFFWDTLYSPYKMKEGFVLIAVSQSLSIVDLDL